MCRKIDRMVSVLEIHLEQTLENKTPSANGTQNVIEEWKKHETYMASMLSHHEVEDLEIDMMLLKKYAEQNLTEEYVKALNNCINKLRHIKETEAPVTGNIL